MRGGKRKEERNGKGTVYTYSGLRKRKTVQMKAVLQSGRTPESWRFAEQGDIPNKSGEKMLSGFFEEDVQGVGGQIAYKKK